MTGSYEEVRLVKFHTPALLSEREQTAARRRFCTLLVPPQKGGFGGNAYVRRVQSGDRAFELALKMPRPDAQPEQEQLNRETLEEEYRTLSIVSNLRGFPTSTVLATRQTEPRRCLWSGLTASRFLMHGQL